MHQEVSRLYRQILVNLLTDKQFTESIVHYNDNNIQISVDIYKNNNLNNVSHLIFAIKHTSHSIIKYTYVYNNNSTISILFSDFI